MAKKLNIGVIGCGNICGQYFKGLRMFDVLNVAACADLDMDRCRAKAAEFGVPRACTVKEMLADPSIDIIVNLTVPKAHAEVNLAAIKAGKHVYCEKPLAVTEAEGRRTVEVARKMGVRVGCAPDTFLGNGLQTCRKLIEDGAIGQPVAATAFLAGRGPDAWHPNPAFFYQVGGGPMFDMGPYYLTALVNLLGPVRRVTGSARITFAERPRTANPHYTAAIPVETPTHLAGVLDFESGAVGTLITSFDVWTHSLPRIEIYGTSGSLNVPDPNTFQGPVRLWTPETKEWREIELTHKVGNARGIGAADMAYGILYDRPHRASGDLAFHVLELMHSVAKASDSGRHVMVKSRCDQPHPLPPELEPGKLDRKFKIKAGRGRRK